MNPEFRSEMSVQLHQNPEAFPTTSPAMKFQSTSIDIDHARRFRVPKFWDWMVIGPGMAVTFNKMHEAFPRSIVWSDPCIFRNKEKPCFLHGSSRE
jgi:hypothetical protein